jgi:hypothetical protein
MPRSRKVIRYNKKKYIKNKQSLKKKSLKKKSLKKKSLKKKSLKKKSLKRKTLKKRLHKGGSDEVPPNEGFFSKMANTLSSVFGKKKNNEYNLMNNSGDGLEKAEQMLIDYSNKKNIETPTRPHAELKIKYDNEE